MTHQMKVTTNPPGLICPECGRYITIQRNKRTIINAGDNSINHNYSVGGVRAGVQIEKPVLNEVVDKLFGIKKGTKMTYLGKELRIVFDSSLYCHDCGCEISKGKEFYACFYDNALDADDGYGMFEEIPICLKCGDE